MFNYPQDLLKELLTAFKQAPERLTSGETSIAARICYCGLCTYLWVKRKGKEPTRCPKCHKPGWNRPLISALLRGSEQKTKGETT